MSLRLAQRSALDRWVKVEPGEGAAVFWACAYFFFLLSSYYVIRPLRDEMGVSGGSGRLTWLYMGTLTGTLVANPIFGALVSRFPRRVFIPVVYRVLIATLLLFYVLLNTLSDQGRVRAGSVFFVWVSVFNLFAVSVFWGFMVDLFTHVQGKRLFGIIGLGGTLGAVAGAAFAASLAEIVRPVNLLLLSAALLEAAVFSVRRLVRIFGVDGRAAAATAIEGVPPGQGVLSGIRLVFASPYLLGICLFLLFYTVSSTFLYFEQARIVGASIHDAGQRTAFFARIDLYVNLLAVLTQSFLTARILGAVGVGATLAFLPALTAGGFAWLSVAPTLATLMVFQVARRAAEYALIRPAREVLFTVVSREEKYASKSFIDTFVYRSGDAVGAWADRLLGILAVGTAGLAGLFVPLAAAWGLVGMMLGRRQSALARTAGAG